jgi:hypothetical protein
MIRVSNILSIHTTYPSHTTLSNFALPNNTDTILLISFANIIFLFGRQEMIFENGFVSYGRYCKMSNLNRESYCIDCDVGAFWGSKI